MEEDWKEFTGMEGPREVTEPGVELEFRNEDKELPEKMCRGSERGRGRAESSPGAAPASGALAVNWALRCLSARRNQSRKIHDKNLRLWV